MAIKSLVVLAVPIHENTAVQVGMMRQLATMPTRKQVWEQMMIHNYRQVHYVHLLFKISQGLKCL